jgi:tetratricopeptide (TPR) repeat protein
MTGLRRRLLAAAVAVAALAATPRAAAEQAPLETDNELLREGLRLYEELEYERAVEALSAALLQPGNSPEEQTQIFQTLGTLHVFLNRPQEAEFALERLLCVDADFDFGAYASPRIREVFDRVRTAWQAEGSPCPDQQAPAAPQAAPVSIDHESPVSARRGEALDLRIAVEDADLRVSSVVVRFRAAGESEFEETTATMVGPGAFEAAIPGEAVAAPAAEYYVQAVDDEGAPLASLGTARAPLRIPVAGGERRSIARQWWFWTIVGVVVVGAGLGVGLGLGLQDDRPPAPGEATLTISVCDGEDRSVCFNQ